MLSSATGMMTTKSLGSIWFHLENLKFWCEVKLLIDQTVLTQG